MDKDTKVAESSKNLCDLPKMSALEPVVFEFLLNIKHQQALVKDSPEIKTQSRLKNGYNSSEGRCSQVFRVFWLGVGMSSTSPRAPVCAVYFVHFCLCLCGFGDHGAAHCSTARSVPTKLCQPQLSSTCLWNKRHFSHRCVWIGHISFKFNTWSPL